MKYVFLMDPLETVHMEKDTSFILMLGAKRKGHEIFYLADGGIFLKDGKVHFHLIEVTPQQKKEQPFIIGKALDVSEDDVDVIFIRSDPPFDAQYLLNTWLLDRISKPTPIINKPSGIRAANEKIWAMQFTSLIPKTLLGRNRSDLLSFISKEKDVIAKPVNGFGGASVFRIQSGDKNTNVILETLTKTWKEDIILQQYISAAEKGDKRILVLNGEPLGAILRVHAPDDHRNNFFSGGKPVATDITARDKEIIRTLEPHLLSLGLYFVGIDILGDHLIEVNVTSPTCLQEMNRAYNVSLENAVIEFAEKLVDRNN